MRVRLLLLSALFTLLVAAILDTPPQTTHNSLIYRFSEKGTVETDAQPADKSVSTTYEYRLEEMKEVNNKIVETYREYEIHKDKDGNVIIRIPTTNYQYLSYEK